MIRAFIKSGAAPDQVALVAALAPLIDGPFTIVPTTRDGVLTIEVDKPTAWTAPQISQTQTAVNNAVADSVARAQARAVDNLSIVEKAILLTIIDQLNVIRSKLSPPLADITVPVAIAAVRTKAGTL